MSMVSLEKYLNQPRKQNNTGPQTHPFSYLELSSRLMAGVCRSVLVGEPFADLSGKLEEVRKTLSVGAEQQAEPRIAGEIEALLQTFQDRVRQTDEQTAEEFKGVLDVLNNAFMQISSRSEQSDERMKGLEASLSRASKIDDLGTLRLYVGKMLEFVRQEGKSDQTGKADLEKLGNQVRQAHQSGSRFRPQIGGREDALKELTTQLTAPDTANLHAALFVADSLRALRVRHGDEIAGTILQDVARKEIQGLAPDGRVFCWSPTSVLLLWDHNIATAAAKDLPNRIKSPLEHRAFVGTRIAVFNIVLRSVVMAARGNVEEVVWALDRFSRGGSGC
jgi:hypothetical protein